MLGVNLSVVFSILGIGVWQCDHSCRRILLSMLHVPVLLLGVFAYELVSQRLSPSYDVAVKNVASFWDVSSLLALAALVLVVAIVPAFVLGDRKVKLLFNPSKAKKALPLIDRERTKPSVSIKTIPVLALLCVISGIGLAAIEDHEEIVFLDALSFEREHSAKLSYIEEYAL